VLTGGGGLTELLTRYNGRYQEYRLVGSEAVWFNTSNNHSKDLVPQTSVVNKQPTGSSETSYPTDYTSSHNTGAKCGSCKRKVEVLDWACRQNGCYITRNFVIYTGQLVLIP
jgi:hypothetical protein